MVVLNINIKRGLRLGIKISINNNSMYYKMVHTKSFRGVTVYKKKKKIQVYKNTR